MKRILLFLASAFAPVLAPSVSASLPGANCFPSEDGLVAALPKNMAAFGISSRGALSLFSSHPPIEARIAALQAQ